jgi:hypothetical protein
MFGLDPEDLGTFLMRLSHKYGRLIAQLLGSQGLLPRESSAMPRSGLKLGLKRLGLKLGLKRLRFGLPCFFPFFYLRVRSSQVRRFFIFQADPCFSFLPSFTN